MSINNILQFIVPKDKKFFPLFENATKNLVSLAETLHVAVNAPLAEREKLFLLIEVLEQKAEEITHSLTLELSKNFITPFDREDIYSLAMSIDDVVDFIHGAASRMRLYQVDKITKSIRKLTEINLEACKNLEVAVKELKNLKNVKLITTACARINKLENKSDNVYDKAVADLFENEKDAKNIMKYKEVLSALETAADKCKNSANIIESITVKHT